MNIEKIEKCDNIAAARILTKILVCFGVMRVQQPRAATAEAATTWLQLLQHYYRYFFHLPLSFTSNTLMCIKAFTLPLEQTGVDVFYIIFTEVGMMILLLHFWYMDTKSWKYMHELEYNKKFTLCNDEEVKLWQQEHKIFAYICFFYIGGGYAVLCIQFTAVLLIDDYRLPYHFWLPFDWHNAQNYWYAYVYECVVMSVTCISNVTMDMMLCYYLFHLSLLYKLIGMRLLALQQFRGEGEAAAEQIIKISELHRSVECMAGQCESLVSVPLLAQIILSAFILCFSAYRLQNINFHEDAGQFLAMLQFISILTLQIFLPCYYANEITHNSNTLTNCIYSANWLEFSVPTRKLIYHYMEFLKRPKKIKAGSFFLIGLPIFTKTMNNAYSLFAVLLNTRK